MTAHPQWILFDFDGTLADSLPVLYGVYCDFLRARGATPTRDEFQRLNGPNLREIANILKTAHGFTESADALHAAYAADLLRVYPEWIPPRPGARLLTAELQRLGHPMAVVTSAPAELAARFLSVWFPENTFHAIVSGEQVTASKPDPAIYQHALRQLNIDANAALAVEDSVNGAASARAAGLRCVHLTSLGSIVDEVLHALDRDTNAVASAECLHAGPLRLTAAAGAPPALDAAANDLVESNWQAAQAACNGAMFNGLNFSLSGLTVGPSGCEVRGRFEEFKRYLAQRGNPTLDLGIRPLGVSGMILFDVDGAPATVIARRAAHLTHAPGLLELVPSGHLNDAFLRADGSVDALEQLREEFAEETGLPADRLLSAETYALVVDHRELVYDVCCVLHVQTSAEELLTAMAGRDEYLKPEVVKICDLKPWLNTHRNQLVAASQVFLDTFLGKYKVE